MTADPGIRYGSRTSLRRPVYRMSTRARLRLLEQMQRKFTAGHPGVAPRAHGIAYDRSMRMMRALRGQGVRPGRGTGRPA